MLDIAEYLLMGALVLTIVSLISFTIVVTSKRHRPAVGVAASRTTTDDAAADSERELVDAASIRHARVATIETPEGTRELTRPRRGGGAAAAAGRFSRGRADVPGTDADDHADADAAQPSHGLAWYANAFLICALILLTAYLGIRMSLTGHGPFANQHEFAVSFTWGILLAYVIFTLRYQLRALALVVLPVTAALLVYALSLDTGIKPLIPALQNNLLLTLHVGFAILAYGAACVSFGAAVLYLLRPKLKLRALPRLETLDEIGYRAAVVTYPLLTIMIVLGAVWANTAWGRYWGWDPKETAAFVTWLIYGAYLHARVVRDWRGTKAAWLLIIGFVSILFAYFGNHFFGGLHSYA